MSAFSNFNDLRPKMQDFGMISFIFCLLCRIRLKEYLTNMALNGQCTIMPYDHVSNYKMQYHNHQEDTKVRKLFCYIYKT